MHSLPWFPYAISLVYILKYPLRDSENGEVSLLQDYILKFMCLLYTFNVSLLDSPSSQLWVITSPLIHRGKQENFTARKLVKVLAAQT